MNASLGFWSLSAPKTRTSISNTHYNIFGRMSGPQSIHLKRSRNAQFDQTKKSGAYTEPISIGPDVMQILRSLPYSPITNTGTVAHRATIRLSKSLAMPCKAFPASANASKWKPPLLPSKWVSDWNRAYEPISSDGISERKTAIQKFRCNRPAFPAKSLPLIAVLGRSVTTPR
jgi:hypothetical protein